MRVFQINTVLHSGSTGRIMAQLKHAVEAAGGECMAAYGRGRWQEPNTFRIGSKGDMYFHAFMTRITDKTAFYSNRNTRKLCAQIESFDPDVIHLHNLHGYYLNVEILFDFLKRYQKPVIWTLHDCWAFTGHCPYFSHVDCTQWKTHCHKCIQQTRYPASRLKDNCEENFTRKKAAFQGVPDLTIVTPSHWLAHLVQQSFLADYPVEVVYNGIDLEQFRPVQSDFRSKYHLEDKIILLGVSNVWSVNKGLNDFLRLASKLDERYQIVLVGLSRQQLRNLPSNIMGMGRTDSIDHLVQLYSAADVFLNLSTEETFGMTTVESLACGTWPIVYADTACEEIVQLSAGTVVPRSMDAIKKAISNDSIRLKNRHIEQFAKSFTNEQFVTKMLELYRSARK